MSRGVRVPTGAEMRKMSDEELVALRADLAACVGSCQVAVSELRANGDDGAAIMRAQRVYQRGQRVAHEILEARHGRVNLAFVKPRPVHDFMSAFETLKCINRLLGVCQLEHEALTDWLAATTDEAEDAALARLEAAHEAVTRALNAPVDDETDDGMTSTDEHAERGAA